MAEETIYELLEKVQNEWGLSDTQMAAFVHVDIATFGQWKEDGRHGVDSPTIPLGMATAVPVVSIYKSLERRFPNLEERIKWLFKENADFGDNKPIDIAASSVENLQWLSYYLDSSRTI